MIQDKTTTIVVDLPKPQKAAFIQAARWEGKKLADWVLGHYIGEEAEVADHAFDLAADAVIEYIQNGVESAMCKYNTKKPKKEKPKADEGEAQ